MSDKKKSETKITTLSCLGLARKLNRLCAESTIEAAVLLALLRYRSKSGDIHPSYESLAADCCCGRASAVRALAHWRRVGIVTWTRTKKSNRFEFRYELAQQLVERIETELTVTPPREKPTRVKNKPIQDGSSGDPPQNEHGSAGMDHLENKMDQTSVLDGSDCNQDGSSGDPQRAFTLKSHIEEPPLKEANSRTEEAKPQEPLTPERLSIWKEAREMHRRKGNEAGVSHWDAQIALAEAA